jgi:ABC-type nitrate/sulfonate/bicarbonate transport system permease component
MKTSVKRRAKNCIRGAVLLACFIAVWYVASCFTQPLFIPSPATVWEAIVGLAETGQLQKGLAYGRQWQHEDGCRSRFCRCLPEP